MPVILGCVVIDKNAHAIVPSDQTVRLIDAWCSSVIRGEGDCGDRGGTASRVLRVVNHTTLNPRSTRILRVLTEWAELAQVFASSRLMTFHRVSIASGVYEIIRGVTLPEFMSNFGDTPVRLRPEANSRSVELLAIGAVRLMQGGEDYPRPGVDF